MVTFGASTPAPMPGRPVAALFAMMTAMAPAFCAFSTFVENSQMPRLMSAILPATAAAFVSAVQPSSVARAGPRIERRHDVARDAGRASASGRTRRTARSNRRRSPPARSP